MKACYLLNQDKYHDLWFNHILNIYNKSRKVSETFFIFNCYLVAPLPSLGHYRGGSLTNLLLITAYRYLFDTGSLVVNLGP